MSNAGLNFRSTPSEFAAMERSRMQGMERARELTFDSRDSGPLTGNFVLEFARVRIAQIDSSLGSQLERMKSCQRDTGAVNELITMVAEYAGGVDGAEKREKLKQAFTAAAAKLPEGYPLRDKLLSMRDGGGEVLNVGNDNVINAEEMSALKTSLDGMLKKIDNVQQEEQLTVNLRMGQRNEVLQLAASLIQSMNETVKGILGRS